LAACWARLFGSSLIANFADSTTSTTGRPPCWGSSPTSPSPPMLP
jgi:hypothetical protein